MFSEGARKNLRFVAARGVLFAALLLAPFLASTASAEIRYSVSLADRTGHLFRVSMIVPDVHKQLTVAMPAWNGLYQIRDFAARVEDVRASSGRRPLAVRAIDGQTWKVTGSGTVRIDYRVYWNRPGPFSSQLDLHHAFINFADVLFYVPTRREEPAQVQLTNVPPEWKVAIELPAGSCTDCFQAPGYDALVDAPVEAGAFSEFPLVVGRARLRVVVETMSGAPWNRKQLEGWLRKIVGYETRLMGGVPFREYLFIFQIGQGAGEGGMEHANGTAIAVPDQSDIPLVAAHEFFHLWNVKRITPRTLEPVDYERPMWTRSLWFVEGVTSTYAAYTLVRTGLMSPERYDRHLGGLITQLESSPARHWQSVEESSLDAWYEKYPFYNRPRRSISYYVKGELDGVLLDILIRNATGNRKSLDDVMRYMNERYGIGRRAYDGTAAVEHAVEHVAGRNFSSFFRQYVAGTAEIPWNRILDLAGLHVEQIPVPHSFGGASAAYYAVSPVENPTRKQQDILNGLLHGTTD